MAQEKIDCKQSYAFSSNEVEIIRQRPILFPNMIQTYWWYEFGKFLWMRDCENRNLPRKTFTVIHCKLCHEIIISQLGETILIKAEQQLLVRAFEPKRWSNVVEGEEIYPQGWAVADGWGREFFISMFGAILHKYFFISHSSAIIPSSPHHAMPGSCSPPHRLFVSSENGLRRAQKGLVDVVRR